MKIGFRMKIMSPLAAMVLLLPGCVAGPEDVAANKKKSEQPPVTASHDHDHDHDHGRDGGDVVQASSDDDGSGFTRTASGLKYRMLRDGDGRQPKASSTVKVHYRGWLDNGKEFDSSYKRGEPIEFPLGGVIPGWTEGLQLVREGGKIELEIPGKLGYGPRGFPPDIPPNATLHFEVELLSVR